MPWIAPTADDVLSEFTPAEALAISSVQGDDNLSGILARAVAEIRGAIEASGAALDADTTKIPPSVMPDAIALARWRLLISLPSLADLQTKERQAAYNDAKKKLADIANNKLSVESPSGTAKSPGNWGSVDQFRMRTDPDA